MRLFSDSKDHANRELGATLIETVVALAVLGLIAIVFLGGLSGTSKAAFVFDEQVTAESIAWAQMEWVQNAVYVDDATYSSAAIPDTGDYLNYSVNITAEPLHSPDEGIQKITIRVDRSGERVITLEGYKRR